MTTMPFAHMTIGDAAMIVVAFALGAIFGAILALRRRNRVRV